MAAEEATAPGLPAGLGPALQIGGAVLTSIFNRRAKGKLKRAKALQRLNTQLANAQAKRQFITAARLARGQVLSAGAASPGGLDSSGTQGALASVATQTEVGLLEQKVVARRNRNISGLTDSAGASQRKGQTFGAVATLGANAVQEFTG